jgi:hypothetical protein
MDEDDDFFDMHGRFAVPQKRRRTPKDDSSDSDSDDSDESATPVSDVKIKARMII